MNRVYIIAEAGVNHNGDINLAYKLIDAAVEAGSDVVKFQIFKAEGVISRFAPKAKYQIKNMAGSNESQLDMARALELKYEDFDKLKEYCDSKGIEFLATPFDYESADYIDNLVGLHKIPSGEITNVPFLKYFAKMGKPIILSTGMSTIDEVKSAVKAIQDEQQTIFGKIFPLTLLHCTSNYPTEFENVNLNAMQTMRDEIGLPVGYSDHTIGIEVSIAAVAMGATVIEKHFTMDHNLPGPDHKASLEPNQLKDMVSSIRNIELSFGNGVKGPVESELEIINIARRSILAGQELPAETVLTRDLIEIKRPGTGISPQYIDKVIGKTLNKPKEADELILWDDLSD